MNDKLIEIELKVMNFENEMKSYIDIVKNNKSRLKFEVMYMICIYTFAASCNFW